MTMLLNNTMTAGPLPSDQTMSKMENIKQIFKKQSKSPFSTFQSYPAALDLRYFNVRNMQRFHRYRPIKKQWLDVTTPTQNNSPVCTKCESPSIGQYTLPLISENGKCSNTSTQRSGIEPKPYCINDYIHATTVGKDSSKKISAEVDPLHASIQQDLVTLRRIAKIKCRKFNENCSNKIRINASVMEESTPADTMLDDKEGSGIANVKNSLACHKLKPLDHVKVSGSQFRYSTLSKRDSPENTAVTASLSSSTCSQYLKSSQPTLPTLPPLAPSSNLLDRQQQQQHQVHKQQHNNRKTMSIQRNRYSYSPSELPANSLTHRASQLATKKPAKELSKITSNIVSKQSISSDEATLSLKVLPPIKQNMSDCSKIEVPILPLESLSDSQEESAAIYTYAGPTTSRNPRSTMIKRNASLLPIILQSSSCIGHQERRAERNKLENEFEVEQDKSTEFCNDLADSEDHDDDEHDDVDGEDYNEDGNNKKDAYYDLLTYKNLINGLPNPVINIESSCGQDDFGILFEQLDHIRETMPDSSIYAEYARNV